MQRVHLKITGHVQGVFFRQSMEDHATRLGLKGWVANREDGSVEAVVEGETMAVDDLVRWTHRGPPGARVLDVVEMDETYSGHEEPFHVREDATVPRQR